MSLDVAPSRVHHPVRPGAGRVERRIAVAPRILRHMLDRAAVDADETHTVASLREATGMAERAVQTGVRDLEATGLIGQVAGYGYGPTRYRPLVTPAY